MTVSIAEFLVEWGECLKIMKKGEEKYMTPVTVKIKVNKVMRQKTILKSVQMTTVL